MVGWHHWLDGQEFEQAPGDGKGQGMWCAAVHGVAKDWTQLGDWETTNGTISPMSLSRFHFSKYENHIQYKIKILQKTLWNTDTDTHTHTHTHTHTQTYWFNGRFMNEKIKKPIYHRHAINAIKTSRILLRFPISLQLCSSSMISSLATEWDKK